MLLLGTPGENPFLCLSLLPEVTPYLGSWPMCLSAFDHYDEISEIIHLSRKKRFILAYNIGCSYPTSDDPLP